MLKIKYIFITVLILYFKKTNKTYLQYTMMTGKYMMCSIYITDSYIKKYLSNKKDNDIFSLSCA